MKYVNKEYYYQIDYIDKDKGSRPFVSSGLYIGGLMKKITNLEDLLHEYKFVPKSKPVFRKRIVWVDNLPETGTKAGHMGYAALVRMLYDIEAITGQDVNRIIDVLDQIMSGGEVY